jgi:hypothetical protein
MDEQRELRSICAHLLALVNNPPKLPDEADVERFHKWVDRLAALGYQVDDFRFDTEKYAYNVRGTRNVLTETFMAR